MYSSLYCGVNVISRHIYFLPWSIDIIIFNSQTLFRLYGIKATIAHRADPHGLIKPTNQRRLQPFPLNSFLHQHCCQHLCIHYSKPHSHKRLLPNPYQTHSTQFFYMETPILHSPSWLWFTGICQWHFTMSSYHSYF